MFESLEKDLTLTLTYSLIVLLGVLAETWFGLVDVNYRVQRIAAFAFIFCV